MTVQQLVDGAPDFLPEERSQTAPPKSTFQELPVDVRRIEALGADACQWLDRYIAFSERWSPRSYDGFHVACAIWLLCVIAARRVVLNLGGRRYTNLYFALCARSSLYAKTTAVKVALEFLGTLGLSSFLAPDESTPQAFIRAMSLHVPKGYSDMDEVNRTQIHMQLAFAAQKGWFYEEFGQKIASMMRDSGVMTDFRGLLRRLDDCPQTYRYEAISRDPDVVIRPYLALLANLTPADLGRYAKRGAALWSDGFFARFAFIVPPTDLPLSLARFPEGEREVPTALMQPLLEWHQRLGIPKVTIREVTGEAGKAGGAFDVSYAYVPEQHCILAPGVREAFYVYHDTLLTLVSSSDQYDLDGNYARFAEKALRIAMLLASLSNEGRIELRHWARAQQIAESWRRDLHSLVDSFAKKEDNDTKEDEESEKVKSRLRFRALSPRELGRALHISAADAEQILEQLAKRGETIKERVGRTDRYRLVDPTASQPSPVTTVTTSEHPVTLPTSDESTATAVMPELRKALPPGWRLEQCDYKGNLSSYGIYMLATNGTVRTEPMPYKDTAISEAWRMSEAEIE